MITLHSDDFGYKNSSDKKIIQLLRKDKLKSISVIINMCHPRSLKSLWRLIQSKPDIRVGLHLNLIEGKSISKHVYIPSLISGWGNLFSLKKFTVRLFLKLIDPRHIEREIRSQVRALKKSGFKVSFIDSHQHLHALSPIAEIVNKVAGEEKIQVIRSYKNIRTYTIIARIKYQLLKLAARLSYLIYFGNFRLPVTWNMNSGQYISFMSWEGNGFDVSDVKDKKMIFVTHPFLPFDTNKSYTSLLL